MYIKWILLFVSAQVLLTIIQFILRNRKFKPQIRALVIAVKVLLAIAFATLVMAGPVQLRPLQPFLIAVYAVLLMDGVADIVYSIYLKARKRERKFYVQKVISLILGILFFVYGTVNMQVIRPDYQTFTSDKLKEEHKIIFVSDIHIGSAQSFSTFEKMVYDMAAQKPEFIILGGDITDDYTSKEEMEKTYKVFGELDIPVYYIHGNHDRQKHAEYANGMQYTAEQLEKTIIDSGVILLKDEFIQIDDEIVLLGREDISEGDKRKSADSLKNPNPDLFLIVADHQPFEFKDNLAVGTDLQLSGHTHAGQLFPLKFFYSFIGYSYGNFTEGDAVMNVSAGACGWRVPFRTDSHCYYELITLTPKQ